jgi:hypothetical protein
MRAHSVVSDGSARRATGLDEGDQAEAGNGKDCLHGKGIAEELMEKV